MLRLHPELMRQAPEALALMAEFTSGVRLRLVTDADRLRITAAFTRYVMAHLERPESRAELLAEVDGVIVDRAVADPTGLVFERRDGPYERGDEVVSTLELVLGPATTPREVVLWLHTPLTFREMPEKGHHARRGPGLSRARGDRRAGCPRRRGR